jgi:hypothetical protein
LPLAAWYNGIFSTCGVMGREIESRQDIHIAVALMKKKEVNGEFS